MRTNESTNCRAHGCAQACEPHSGTQQPVQAYAAAMSKCEHVRIDGAMRGHHGRCPHQSTAACSTTVESLWLRVLGSLWPLGAHSQLFVCTLHCQPTTIQSVSVRVSVRVSVCVCPLLPFASSQFLLKCDKPKCVAPKCVAPKCDKPKCVAPKCVAPKCVAPKCVRLSVKA